MRKPTPKQQLIINQLLVDSNMKTCAKVVGCAHDYVRQCMVKPHIIFAFKEAAEKVAAIAAANGQAIVDAAWVLNAAVKVYDRCMQVEPVLDSDGNKTGEYRFEHAGANKAIDTIAKHRTINAFQPDSEEAQPAPSDNHWVVEIVHTSAEEYQRRVAESKERPPIEHQP